MHSQVPPNSQQFIYNTTLTQQIQKHPSAMSTTETSEGDDDHRCKICFGQEKPLLALCECSGSIKYVHEECIVEWICKKIYISQTIEVPYCQICQAEYSAHLQPTERELSLELFLQQLREESVKDMAVFLFYTLGAFFGLFLFMNFIVVLIELYSTQSNFYFLVKKQIIMIVFVYGIVPAFFVKKSLQQYRQKKHLIDSSYVLVVELSLYPAERIDE